MNKPHDYAERWPAEVEATSETPISLLHLVKTIRAYLPVIGISMAVVAVGYAVCAMFLYVLSPAQRVIMQPFRLEFRGATRGELPNGVRFSPIEIISAPVLLRVFQADNLARFTTFRSFSRSVFILESNPAYEKLVNEYQARLSDPKLSPLDRDRMQNEFETKRESISKNDFTLSYAPVDDGAQIPPTMVKKVLVDILSTWASFAINERHALDYRVAVLSPSILDEQNAAGGNPIIRIQILRSKIYRVIENIELISSLPAAELAKTKDGMSLAEIRMRLEDIVRFRLEPLVGVARASGVVGDPTLTIHFLQTQLAFDQRRLQAAQTHKNGLRDALLIYSTETPSDAAVASGTMGTNGEQPRSEGEMVMPQLSDTFIDRILLLSKQATDAEYRQNLIDDYRRTMDGLVPLEQAVAYQQQLIEQVRRDDLTGLAVNEKTVQSEITASTEEARAFIVKLNEVYQSVSRNLHPSTQFFSVVGPPSSSVERSRTLGKLALYGVIVLLIALPVIVLICLVHNRIREEAQAERMVSAVAEEPV